MLRERHRPEGGPDGAAPKALVSSHPTGILCMGEMKHAGNDPECSEPTFALRAAFSAVGVIVDRIA